MKFDFYHYGSDVVIGDTIERLPILDWRFWYAPRNFEVKNRKFTGKYNSVFFVSIVVFRYAFCLRIKLNEGETTSELAKKEYHNRIKLKEKL